jgi:hypothetical protein
VPNFRQPPCCASPGIADDFFQGLAYRPEPGRADIIGAAPGRIAGEDAGIGGVGGMNEW